MARKSAKTTKTTSDSPAKASPKTRKAAAKPRAKAPAASRSRSSDGAVPSGKILVIVESPKKAKSIGKFLGSGYTVKASMGHVRDLPEKGRDLGIDVAKGYKPNYVVPDKKKSTVSELKREAERASLVYLATDPDREGEAIAWHLQHALGLADDRVRRVLFFEITERAVREAFQHVGPIDMNKVNAQQTRRFLDRFVGYQVSPLLWRKIARGLSAGRVQSVAVRLIAEREKEIRAFVPEEYWKITATLSPAASQDEAERFRAELAEWNGSKFQAKNEADARTIHVVLQAAAYSVTGLETSEKLDKAEGPFKTSTLQQQAAIRLRFAGKKTMKIAQELYEGIDVDGSGPTGLITYMRTDSLRVSVEAIEAVRDLIQAEFGASYLPDKPNRYAAGKMAQEAHEAIRPTDLAFIPERIREHLTHDQFRLYQLVYRRFVASQMTPAVFEVTNVEVTAAAGLFKTQGKILRFDGYRRVLPPAGKQEDALLPPLSVGQALDLHELTPTQHFTQPPPRYSEAALIKALEKENIGRPSTYATIIQTIQDRGYVEQQERRFYATNLGIVVTDQLVAHFPKILDMKFTAHMEDELDDIVTGKEDMTKVLDEFYHPFQNSLQTAEREMARVSIPSPFECPKCNAPMILKFSKGKPFHSCSRYPDCKGTRNAEGQPSNDVIETEHMCPKCSKPLLIRKNKKGEAFYSCSGYPKCKESFDIGPDDKPVARPGPETTEHACPKCGKPMILRQSARGPFLGCSGYPKCRGTMPVDGEGKPVVPVTVPVPCPKCGGTMAVKQGRRGAFLGCVNYPKCRGTAPVPEDIKEQVAVAAPPKPAGPDLKTIVVEETCDDCGGPMVVRRGRRGPFLGCSNYPKCHGTKEPSDATKEKITAALGE